MITGGEFERFETQILRNEKLDMKKKFKILESLYREAVALGKFPLKDSLEGLEVDIRIAKGINGVSGKAGSRKGFSKPGKSYQKPERAKPGRKGNRRPKSESSLESGLRKKETQPK